MLDMYILKIKRNSNPEFYNAVINNNVMLQGYL